MILSVSAVIGFAVYYELVEVSFLEPVSSNGMKVFVFINMNHEFKGCELTMFVLCCFSVVARLVTKSWVPKLAGCYWIYNWCCQRSTLSVSCAHYWNNKTNIFSVTNAFDTQQVFKRSASSNYWWSYYW